MRHAFLRDVIQPASVNALHLQTQHSIVYGQEAIAACGDCLRVGLKYLLGHDTTPHFRLTDVAEVIQVETARRCSCGHNRSL